MSADALKNRLAALEAAQEPEANRERTAPAGWEPGVVWEGTHGTITTGALDETPRDWDDLLRSRGLDPDMYEVVGDTLRWCSWDGWRRDAQGEQATSCIQYSFKAEIRRRGQRSALPEECYQAARKAKKPKKAAPKGNATFVVALSDWQTGNGDNGGVEAQAAAAAALIESVPQRLADLRRAGHEIGTVCIAGLGDLVEGCAGFYASQQFRTQLDRRDQVKFVRRAVRDLFMAVAPHADKIVGVAVPGNHGENRQNGKAFTSVHDNDDVAVFEQVAEILATNPDVYGHVGWRLTRDEIAVCLNLSGQHVAFTHGHVARPKGNAAETLWGWWEKQAMGRKYASVADANLLIAGHYHHLNVKEQEGRTVLITPSLTQVSEYWADQNGVTTRCGTLTLVVAPDGWGELTII
jgi:hypothetical protein